MKIKGDIKETMGTFLNRAINAPIVPRNDSEMTLMTHLEPDINPTRIALKESRIEDLVRETKGSYTGQTGQASPHLCLSLMRKPVRRM